MFQEKALKRILARVKEVDRGYRTKCPEIARLLWNAGHYVFNAVAEFIGPATVRLIAYESSLDHLCTGDMAVDWFLSRYDENRDKENSGWGAHFTGHRAIVNCEHLQSMKLFPVEHLPLLINWEEKYPRFEALLKNGLGRASSRARQGKTKLTTIPS